MFTGLIEEIGEIADIKFSSDIRKIYIKTERDFLNNIKLGDSIAIDGVCLTVESVKDNLISFSALKSTIKKSIIQFYKKGSKVNLEKALTLNKQIGGHIVNGHVDTIGRIVKLINYKDSMVIEINIDSKYGKYLIENDSIAVNGISLTIKNVYGNTFSINIIPETIKRTNLNNIKHGDNVNIEISHLTKSVYEFVKRG